MPSENSAKERGSPSCFCSTLWLPYGMVVMLYDKHIQMKPSAMVIDLMVYTEDKIKYYKL